MRHGNTEFNNSHTFQPHDTPLSDLGVEQAKNLGERLKPLNIVKILTSDLVRTKQTTEQVVNARSHPVEVVEHEILREREFGDLKGTSFASMKKELFHPSSDYVPPNGESWPVFHERVNIAWEWVLAQASTSLKSPHDVLLVVTHGLVKSTLANKHWGLVDQYISFENTSVSIVSAVKPHQVQEINCTIHLKDLSKL